MNNKEKQSVRVGEHCVVNIDVTSADVTVKGWEQPEVAVAASPEQVNVHQDGDTVSIRPTPLDSVDLVVHVPHQCDLNLHLVSGDAVLQDITGQIAVQTMSGDITGRNLRGSAHLHSVSGDATLSASHLHDLTVDTVSGDTLLESALDDEGNYRVRTVSGDLRLRIPEDQRCTIFCQSLSGEFRSNLPYESSHSGWGKINAEINGGGVEFRVRTASGNVRVEAAGELPAAAPRKAEQPRQEQPRQERQPPQSEAASRATRPLEQQPEEQEPFAVDEHALEDYDEPGLSPAAQRMRILKAIEEGRLSVSKGLEKLRAIQ
jgi:hypothetical protein